MRINGFTKILADFWLPLFLLVSLLSSILISNYFHNTVLTQIILLFVITFGSYRLFYESFISILHKQFALDYIAILAIVIGVASGEYFVAGVIALMLATGRSLEDYGMKQAKQSLTALVDRIPNTIHLYEDKQLGRKQFLHEIKIGQIIAVRKGEIVPLDGVLESENAFIDESTLTGEAYPSEKKRGDLVRSGTVNIGDLAAINVTTVDKNSTYTKIINMVKAAQSEKAPFIRLADKYSLIFTLITFLIAIISIFLAGNFSRLLAVLVIATPCPLILATPIALIGGMNAAAKQKIVIKKISNIEILSRINTLIFDKTGTLTLGKPVISKIIIKNKLYTDEKVLSIASAIERSSLHPLAKALVNFANIRNAEVLYADNVKEKIGTGISGTINKKIYSLSRIKNPEIIGIELTENNKQIALFIFEDKIKSDSEKIINQLKKLNLNLMIYTGDKIKEAEKVARKLGSGIYIKAECTPEDKKNGIQELKKQKRITAMVGDGINDAPALAMADVGMVFSNEEQTAASEAADIVFLAGDLSAVIKVITIAKRSIKIAIQSITTGIGLSILGMLLAAFGFVPPLLGAVAQEAIDVIVILNALRASRS